MPTEHEYKYCISKELIEFYDHSSLLNKSSDFLLIKQGYLAFSKGMTLRIRSAIRDGKEKWYLTFKQKVGNRVIEIEKKLDDRDGNDLWSTCVGKLTKERYVIKENNHIWELDVFHKHNQVYFIQLEVELKEGEERPSKVPKFLKNFIIYEVPLTDERFSNKRLADVEYANLLYSKLKNEKISED